MIHTVKGFGVINKAEADVFLELSCFFDDPTDAGDLISGLLTMTKPLTVWITINWKILKKMGIPDHLTCLEKPIYRSGSNS